MKPWDLKHSISGKLLTTKKTGREFISAINNYLKEFGKMKKESKESRLQNSESIKDNLKITSDGVRESFFGVMESTTKANGKMVRKMVVDTGDRSKARAIWANGKTVK